VHRSGTGGRLTDWLLVPPHADPSARLPLIIMPYPGTTNGEAPPSDFGLADFEPMLSPPLLAAHGYAVLEPSLPIGGKEPVEDIVAALRPAIAAAIATGRVDPARIGVLGHSYGGYTALVMATEIPCLRSVVASAAVSDLLLAYGSLDARLKVDFAEGLPTLYPFAWAEDGQGRMGVPPWRDPQLYLRNSPFYRLDRVTAPVLLLHGDLDPLSVSDVERTYAALYRLGKDARLVRFYGEGHVPQSPATIRARWRETFAWLDRTMGARPGAQAGGSFAADGTCGLPS
jgi:dipeptidyl aminopeptidase/acylaminoacyl peptidase